MVRKKPSASQELKYLRTVLSQPVEKDDPADIELARYRGMMETDPKWVLSQKRIAEIEYRNALDVWDQERKAKEELAKLESRPADSPLERDACVALVDKLLTDWTKYRDGQIDVLGNPIVKGKS
jgi:hypothetical protein